jgi:hypothetical protein
MATGASILSTETIHAYSAQNRRIAWPKKTARTAGKPKQTISKPSKGPFRKQRRATTLDFTTQRFARRADDPDVVHAEVVDESGRLLAALAVPIVN